MLPEVGASELIVLAIVALIVVGPKDLPVLLRALGKGLSKMRALAADFRSSFDEMARQSELDELRKEVEALRNAKMDPIGDELEGHLDEVHNRLTDTGSKPALDPGDEYQLPPMPEQIYQPEPIFEPEPEVAAEPGPVSAADAELAADAPAKPRKPRAPRKPKAETGS